jgi:murein DD-endopeptidase MepM/ murein hydrolase activator NlpD
MQPRFGQRDPFEYARRYGPPPRCRSRAGFVAALCTILVLALWAVAATLYPLYRDDALRILAERQMAMARAHDARVVSLEAEIDRLKSLKLIEQERIDRAVAELARRQTALETRQSALTGIAGARASAGVRGETWPEITGAITSPAQPTVPAASAKPAPISDTILLAPPAERWARLESRPAAPLGRSLAASEANTPMQVRIANLGRGLERLEAAGNTALNRIEEDYDGLETRMRNVMFDLGLKSPPGGGSLAGNLSGLGGPFLLFSRPPQDPFERQLGRVRAAAAAVEELKQGLAMVPVRRPILGESEVTSGFGMRVDPFLKQLALHTGVDFRSEPGDPVRAAAAGRVMQAGVNGGYGLMVEIDHGNGLTTRYAHLSAVMVSEGAHVAVGDPIGRVGTTGRSTGPHLHYEVRINGEAVDPQKFLRAGLRLAEPRAAE